MTFDRRTLLALPLAAGIAPAALLSDAAGQSAANGGANRGARLAGDPVWPPAERFALWPGIPAGAPTPLPRPRR
ncbi:hypothetical protein QP185_02095 [Sphingomonas aerolata]|uniref:hypothetical protein n=1 Tax=Sphingomonas aerolata TaxID=185951 RepID=UPI002FE12DCB